MNLLERLALYEKLMRLDKPIGTLLLLWPTLTALWIAAEGAPPWSLVWIFSLGTLLMRSAGCVMNDYADRKFDRHVKRTAERPLATGRVRGWEAAMLVGILVFCSFVLIVKLHPLVIKLSFVALFLAVSYPLTKRFFAIPQAYLGVAFGFGIPMAFAAIYGSVPNVAWALLAANVLWAIAYDTEYAMVDRDDDMKIGIHTSAILFGRADVFMIMLCYTLYFMVTGYVLVVWAGLGGAAIIGLMVAMGMAIYHLSLIRERSREGCFKAFLHNNWLGAAIFFGVAADYAIRLKAWPGL
jgi:4-hydroxybenzoate polyprenyltransferase